MPEETPPGEDTRPPPSLPFGHDLLLYGRLLLCMSLYEPFGSVVIFAFLPFLRLSCRSQFAWPSLRLSCLDSTLRLEKGMKEEKIGESALQEPVTALNG